MTNKPSTNSYAKDRLGLLAIAVVISALLVPILWLSRGFLSGDSMPQQQVGVNSGITLDRYEQVKAGMTISTVETIVGEGKEMSRVEMPGAPLTISYSWQNADGSNMNAIFQGDSLISKAQAGLK